MKITTVVPVAMVFLALFLASCFGQGMAQTMVTGKVCDAEGNPVTHAYVEAIPVITKNSGGTVGNLGNPWVPADSQGIFSLILAPGRYRMRAKDETDGYPDPSFWVNLDPKARFPEITVSDKPIKGIEVVLGTQGGILSGELKDARTGESLSGVKIRIEDASNSGAYVEVFTDHNGHFQYTVASKPILIFAATPGYKVIAFENGAEIMLSPGEHREFQLAMEHQ